MLYSYGKRIKNSFGTILMALSKSSTKLGWLWFMLCRHANTIGCIHLVCIKGLVLSFNTLLLKYTRNFFWKASSRCIVFLFCKRRIFKFHFCLRTQRFKPCALFRGDSYALSHHILNAKKIKYLFSINLVSRVKNANSSGINASL